MYVLEVEGGGEELVLQGVPRLPAGVAGVVPLLRVGRIVPFSRVAGVVPLLLILAPFSRVSRVVLVRVPPIHGLYGDHRVAGTEGIAQAGGGGGEVDTIS